MNAQDFDSILDESSGKQRRVRETIASTYAQGNDWTEYETIDRIRLLNTLNKLDEVFAYVSNCSQRSDAPDEFDTILDALTPVIAELEKRAEEAQVVFTGPEKSAFDKFKMRGL
jgi:hypothetical protein